MCRALQRHPTTPGLYVLAATHELAHGGVGAARALLQRGIRLCGGEAAVWGAYVGMEMGFVEGLRRRWGVLGIQQEKEKEGEERVGEGLGVDLGGEGETAMDDAAAPGVEETAGEDGERARQAIMDGAIIKTVISSAIKGALLSSIPSSLLSPLFPRDIDVKLYYTCQIDAIRFDTSASVFYSIIPRTFALLYSIFRASIPSR